MLRALALALTFAPIALFLVAWPGFSAQGIGGFGDSGETRSALVRAQAEARAASARASKLEGAARDTRAAAEKTGRESAALAARIQESEAGIAAARARIALARRERVALDRRLAERREPLIRLTAGLQKLARRPLAVAVLRPGSLRETVYLRAMLETTLPEVRRRTGALRGELERGKAIEAEARSALAALDTQTRALNERRTRLAALESRQRLESRQAGGAAAREAERALAYAEEARDLDSLLGRIDEAGDIRRQLAALPGPVLRPPRPGESVVVSPDAVPTAVATRRAARVFQLPVTGRIVAGFGVASGDGGLTKGISLAPVDGAQVVAPAAGRVAFAGPFRGFDRIVIIEHPGGLVSLITGLARADVEVGDELIAGAPLGVAGSRVAGAGQPFVVFELRRDGEPVNPLAYLR